MANKHDWLLDYFNDCLDDESKREFEVHLQECQACREELEEIRELTQDLPYAAPPADPPEGMKARVLHRVLAESREDESDREHTAKAIREERNQQPKRKKKWWTPVLAAVLLMSLLGNAYAILGQNQGKHEKEQIASATKSVQLQSTKAMKQSTGSATLLKGKEDQTHVVVQANDLKQLQGDKVYQVWLINNDEPKNPHRAGTFVPDQKGGGAVSYQMKNAKDHNWDQVAISQEPDAHSQKPNGDIILASDL